MNGLTYGELCAGYGGLGMGVQSVLGGETRWVSEFDAHPSRILAHHWPDAPNLGDMTKVDWTQVEPVDVITGGTPCQDLSHAGKRAGMTEGTRSNLWVQMREAIAVIRPRLVVWENVRGAYSAGADSALEHCPGCMGGAEHGRVALRALGRVLGDLSDLGYDAGWYGLRAADVGACHGRFRVFVYAVPADSDLSGLEGLADQAGASPTGRHGHVVEGAGGPAAEHVPGQLTLLPTPAVNDMGAGKTPDAWDAWDAWTDRMKSEHGNGNGHGKSLEIEALRLLPTATVVDALLPTPRSTRGGSATETAALLPTPRAQHGETRNQTIYYRPADQPQNLENALHHLLPTPSVADTQGGRKSRSGERSNELLLNGIAAAQDWSVYETGIRRHEAVMGQPAPLPTETGPKGGARLSPAFVEWMMMLPAGQVTDPAIWEGMTNAKGRVLTGDQLASAARNAQLKALGNGVVPAQAAAAARMWLRDMARIAGAA